MLNYEREKRMPNYIKKVILIHYCMWVTPQSLYMKVLSPGAVSQLLFKVDNLQQERRVRHSLYISD